LLRARQTYAAEQLAEEALDFDNVMQCVRLRRADNSGVAALAQKLCDYVIVILYLRPYEWGAEEVFEGIDEAVEVFEGEEGGELGGGREEEGEGSVDDGEKEGWRVGVREVYEGWSGCWVCIVQG
jgi:hypothetical protein